jgi:hypothetical protein
MIRSNTAATPRAMAAVRGQVAKMSLGSRDVLSLGYISDYSEPDGQPVAAFRPGWTLTTWPADQTKGMKVACLADGTKLYFSAIFPDLDSIRFAIDVIDGPLVLFSLIGVSR